jgi:capsular polysaccharide biosynthesis protein
LVFGVFAFVYSTYFISTLYTSEASVYVNSLKSFNLNAESVTQATLTATEKLVPTYAEIVKSKKVISQAIKETKLDYSVDRIQGMLETTVAEGTGVFYISIKSADPRHSALLANTIAEIAIGEIENYIEGTSAKIIDYAEIPEEPTSPNIKLNTLLGFVLGIFFSVAAIVLIDLFDVRIKTEDDLTQVSKYPILGNIPRLESEEGGNYEYYSRSKYSREYRRSYNNDREVKSNG